jgi:hypothetical protein
MRVAVLGAGIQGCCLALELASSGVNVDLYDRNEQPFTQASLLNEAKIHLGFFYANEPSMQTARLVMQGALTFLPYLRRLLGPEVDSIPVSRPYIYAVHRDSMLSFADIESHLARTSRLIVEVAGPDTDYFGLDPRQPIQALPSLDGIFDPAHVVAAFQTPEVGISADALARLTRSRLAREPNVHCVMGATVMAATPRDASVDVTFEVQEQCVTESYDHAVNALWDGRLKVDATAGVVYAHPWLFRTKYNLHLPQGALQAPLPSVSFVLGAFGDIVQYAGGGAYLSWYPAGLTAVTPALEPAAFWPQMTGPEADTIRRASVEALSALLPGMRDAAPQCLAKGQVKGGIIFAWGDTDITDPRSELHARHDVGPRSYGRYHSVDTGKFTTAPLFARQLAEAIAGS